MGTLSIVKPTGVFSLSPNTRTNSSWPSQTGEGWSKINASGLAGVSTDADLINGLILPSDASVGWTGWLSNAGPAAAINNAIGFSFLDTSAAIYSLDGGAPISYNALPPGILFRLRVKATVFSSACGGDVANHLKCQLNNILEADVTSATAQLFTALQSTGFPVDPLDSFILPSVFIGYILQFSQTFTNNFCDLRPTPTGTGNLAIFSIMGLDISGEYVTESVKWTLSPTGLILPDNVITLTRPDTSTQPPNSPGTDQPTSLDTQQIEQIVVNGKTLSPNDPWVIVWLRFKIKIHLNVAWLEGQPPTITIKAKFIGTSFGGIVDIGTLAITYADLSGVYFFDSTSRSDLLYDRSTVGSIKTREVLIPAPFFVTAFSSDNDTDIIHFGGTRIRVTGQGTLHQVFQSYDYINTQQLPDLTLRTTNNVNPFVLASFIDQQASLRVYMDTIRDYMNVSRIITFSIPMYTGYPG